MPAPPDLRASGRDLLTGKLGGAAATRAEAVIRLNRDLLGPEAPAARVIPEPRLAAEKHLRTLPATPKERSAAEGAALALVRALLQRKLGELAAHLHEVVWVLWPDGSLARHDRDALLEHLAARGGARQPAEVIRVRSYTPAELRSAVPRGVPEALEQLLGGAAPIAVTMQIDRPTAGVVGATVLMSKHEAGQWRAHDLLVPQLDLAVRSSLGSSRDEDEAVRMADRLVRHLVYGHDKHVVALRNHVMPKVMLSAELLEPAEKLPAIAAAGPHRFDALDTVFRGTERRGMEVIERHGGRALVEMIKRRAKEAWGRPLDRLKWCATSTTLAAIDPTTLEPAGARELPAICVAVKDGPERPERWRVGAVFL